MSSSAGSDSDFTVGGDSKQLSSHGEDDDYSDSGKKIPCTVATMHISMSMCRL